MGNTRIVDRIGNNTGTLQNGASLVASGIPNAGAANRAARFQGSDDHMSISIQSLPTLQVAKSIALWINPDALSHSGMRTILALATSNDSSGSRSEPTSDARRSGAGAPPRARRRSSTTGPGPTAGITWSTPTTLRAHTLYVDGVLVGSAMNLPVTGTIGNAVLGCYDADQLGWEMYEGLLDDLRIYDKVLSQTEIDRLQQGE